MREARMMLLTLMRDLAEMPGLELLACADALLPQGEMRGTRIAAAPRDTPFDLYQRGLMLADAVWPIAPETGGILERLSITALSAGKILLGSYPDAIRVAASKRETYRTLASESIPAVATFNAGEAWPDISGAWVVKPDDGAGCEDTFIFADQSAARAWLERRGGNLIAQPWIEGEALSLCVLYANGQARLLCVNAQHIFLQDGRISVDALDVNAVTDANEEFQALAERTATALPGLRGYAGIDLIRTGTPDGAKKIVVLEVNPRMTTSFCALREALGLNVAELVLDLHRVGRFPDVVPRINRRVEINLAMGYV
jgi:tyramine---L-glutamate ligase